jgi:hypothetical protein
MAVQAMQAIGKIKTPLWTVSFNPTNRTLVNFDTWFWAEGLDGTELTGSSALGLVAHATPDRLVVTAGDGSGPLTCKWVTSKSDACHYAYRRSSLGGSAVGRDGAPAYEPTGTAYWKLWFENNGVRVTIPGAQSELKRTVTGLPLVVVEVQTIVTSVG